MTTNPLKTDSLHDWLTTPAGGYLLAWEQSTLNELLVDVFGFHALQIGLDSLNGLQANRMPHRWLALETPDALAASRCALVCDSVALPFPDASLDVVVLPHALELSRDPHATLREVERVLVPEGRVVVCGLNPLSMWGVGRKHANPLTRSGEKIGQWRLRDWLQLLSFEVETLRWGCYRPALRSQTWFDRWAWLERIGARWWPIFGAVYCVVAVKRVRGMRLMEPIWKRPTARSARSVSAASKGME